MKTREGLIPTVLGAAVTTAATAAGAGMMKKEYDRNHLAPMVAAGIAGFGLAHIVLGSIDLVEHRK